MKPSTWSRTIPLVGSLVVYSPLAHMVWHPDGLLRRAGVHDFAGGTVVHISAGFAALAGAMIIGQRRGLSAHSSPANVPLVLLGTGMLWFGWFGFNAGCALAANGLAVKALLNSNTASAAALLAWLFLDMALGKNLPRLSKIDPRSGDRNRSVAAWARAARDFACGRIEAWRAALRFRCARASAAYRAAR